MSSKKKKQRKLATIFGAVAFGGLAMTATADDMGTTVAGVMLTFPPGAVAMNLTMRSKLPPGQESSGFLFP